MPYFQHNECAIHYLERGRGEPLEARVCFDTPVNGAFASDHFGVIATISA